jgi:uncharacterized membrane protein (UPF0127 family)
MTKFVQIVNETRALPLATMAEVADTFATRGRGLLGRTELPEGYALVIYPEWSIHMMFMKIPLDILFVDQHDRVVGLRHRLPPWSPFAGVAPWRGKYVIELPAGVLASTNTQLGDQLRITPELT